MSTQEINFYSDELNARVPYAWGNELEWLRDHARYFNTAVMIGAGPGVMGVALMEGNENLNLMIVDIDTCRYVKAHLEDAGFGAVEFAVMDSAECGNNYAGEPLDFLIVDGDHTYEGVMRDVDAWWKHIKTGGLIFFHDVKVINNDQTNGVEKAISHLIINRGYNMKYLYGSPGISEVYEKQ